MKTMTSQERVRCMFVHQEADRIPIWESAWGSTIERWRREGMDTDNHVAYFGLDRIELIYGLNNSPNFPEQTIEETDEHRIYTTNWGVTFRNWKHRESVPEFMNAAIQTADDWYKVKSRMAFCNDRVPWARLKRDWPRWREQGTWIMPSGWFGFDVSHSSVVGTERLLLALAEDPEWLVDMWQTQLDLYLAILDRIWDAGYHFDGLRWPDDMGYKFSQFFSLDMYRNLLKPIHQQAIDWAHRKGVIAYLHSCGDIRPFISDLVAMGLDGLNPLEVKAGVDPLAVKREFGARLLLHGGFNALLWHNVAAMETTVRSWLPVLKQGGGYIFSTDHSTPSDVSLNDFRRIVETVKQIGKFG